MRFSDLEGLTIGLWGLGVETRSFLTAARRAFETSRIPVLVQDRPAEGLDAVRAAGIRVVGAESAQLELARCDVVVRSPGVSIYRSEIRALRGRGLATVTPTGLWLEERRGERVLGFTGTKGKSTTANLSAHLLRAELGAAHLAGNIGSPALDLLDASSRTWVVLELSSYQISDLEHGPQVAALTNVFPEHLDWHLSEEAYRRDKLRLFGLPGVEKCVLPESFVAPPAAGLRPGSERIDVGGARGWRVEGGRVFQGQRPILDAGDIPLRGDHNARNLCTALAAIEATGVGVPPLPEALSAVGPLRHRLETVLKRGGVEWVDDSISTTPESTIAALDSFQERPIILIAGGMDRAQDYGALAEHAAARDVVVLALPENGPKLVEAVRHAGVPESAASFVSDMDSAVDLACRRVPTDGVVLLSPAAPSYGVYSNFEERGDHFATLARAAPRMD